MYGTYTNYIQNISELGQVQTRRSPDVALATPGLLLFNYISIIYVNMLNGVAVLFHYHFSLQAQLGGHFAGFYAPFLG